MKRLLGFIAVVLLAALASTPAFAQDNPALGTWKLNVAKSKFTGAPAPKELTRTLTADGDSVKYTFAGTAADGSTLAYSFTAKFDGKDYPVEGKAPGGFDHIAIKKVNDHTYEVSQKREDKAVGSGKATVAKDGKTTTVTLKYTNTDGKSVSTTSLYEKQ
jgi:major membrane immunogen (membrane-anchored lipoprotein)